MFANDFEDVSLDFLGNLKNLNMRVMKTDTMQLCLKEF